MATMQQQALAKAQELGIELTYEDHDDLVEVWSLAAHLSEIGDAGCHTYFVHREDMMGKKLTNAGMWREALRYMAEDLTDCPADCDCRAEPSVPHEGESCVVLDPEPEPETPAEQPEAPVSGTFAVVWPEAVGKIFFPALGRDGATILASAHGLDVEAVHSRMHLIVTGDHDKAMVFAATLPHIFTDANERLKVWRKTSPNYKCHDLKTTEGRRDAWTVEQQWLRDFCTAVAGTFTNDQLAADGVQAGLAYANDEEA